MKTINVNNTFVQSIRKLQQHLPNLLAVGEYKLKMDKSNSTEELKVAKNTKLWSMGKPDSHDYVSVLEGNQLVVGKPNSIEELKDAKNTKCWSMGKPNSQKDKNILEGNQLVMGS